MGNKLTEAQRTANPCPDCGDDPDDLACHRTSCRRIAMSTIGYPELQFGPPWADWPDDVKPINPRTHA